MRHFTQRSILLLLSLCLLGRHGRAAEPASQTPSRGERMLTAYFAQETARLQHSCLADIRSLEDWKAKRPEYLRQLHEMLGLDPLPPREELQAQVTGTTEHPEFLVERVHFQSLPGLYVTGDLYRPREQEGPLPAILYVCGHGAVKKKGVSYGNKVHYQHHGAWFARNGYVCLTIDSLQLGEIEGLHHGTHHLKDWWWLDRGYTPAGVEAWNCIRALDYLETRPEVDAKKLGVTGRSGGGAYSWWIAALDERIQAAVPVAGITDLQNHVVDGCVEGHCDCMFFMNTYRWDYPLLAALVAPRPLLISNTDSDTIFPLDGVVRVFEQARRIYTLHHARDRIALNITAGGHKDTQELQVHAFRWLNQHLKKSDALIETTAVRFFEPEDLQVFDKLPQDQKNTQIQESFVAAAAEPQLPADAAQWQQWSEQWHQQLTQKVFRGWPGELESLNVQQVISGERDGLQLKAFDFTSQGPVRLRLYVVQGTSQPRPGAIHLTVLDESTWSTFLASLRPTFAPELEEEGGGEGQPSLTQSLKTRLESEPIALAFVAPRGIGLSAWNASEKKQTHHLRRFYLLGQTLESMQAWDIRRSLQTVRALAGFSDRPVTIQAQGPMAVTALYASYYEPPVQQLLLLEPSSTHREGPHFLNVLRFLDVPQAMALAASRAPVTIFGQAEPWAFTQQVLERTGAPGRIHIQPASDAPTAVLFIR